MSVKGIVMRESMLRIIGVQVGKVVPMASDRGEVMTAIAKSAVTGPILAGVLGLDGDAQGNTVNHGGPDKAICVHSADAYGHWMARLGKTLVPGAFGENLTVAGIDEATACIGDTYTAGTARVQVTQPRTPCYKLSALHDEPQLADWVAAHGGTGWYLRVVAPGEIWAGASMDLESRPHPRLTIAEANRVLSNVDVSETDIERLLVPELATSFGDRLRLRLRPRV
jgi:MOSC domain-containing protein YiiM